MSDPTDSDEVERLRAEVTELRRAYCQACMEADGLRAEVERLRAEVGCVKADLAYERGKVSVYEAEIERLRPRLAAAERVCEVAAKRLKHYIDMPLADALDAWRAARGGDRPDVERCKHGLAVMPEESGYVCISCWQEAVKR